VASADQVATGYPVARSEWVVARSKMIRAAYIIGADGSTRPFGGWLASRWPSKAPPVTHLTLDWAAASASRLFPLMKADLLVYPLTATETQLDFSGRYEPPLGWLGTAVNAAIGHRIAEASVHRFVSEVAEYLRTTLRSM
jgi:hypothetical protein